MKIIRLGASVFAVDKVFHHARFQRPRTVQRDQRHDVLEGVRLQTLDQVFHAARFELEHGGSVGGLQQIVGCAVVERNGLYIEGFLLRHLPHISHRPIDDGQRAQPQKVELHQTDFFYVVLIELADRAVAAFGAIQRTEVGQFARRNQHAACVHTDVARQVFQSPAQLQHFFHAFFAIDNRVEFRLQFARFFQRYRLYALQRHQLGKPVAQAVRKIQHAPDIADHGLGCHGAEGDDLRHALRTVFFPHMIDHQFASVLTEVHVEVGHGYALGIEEALEQQRIAQRVEIGDAQAVGHQRTRAGAAPRPDRHAVGKLL